MLSLKRVCSEPVSGPSVSIQVIKPSKSKYRIIKIRDRYRAQVKWGPFWCGLLYEETHLIDQRICDQDLESECMSLIKSHKRTKQEQALLAQEQALLASKPHLVVYEE